jgi:PKD repeat protein
MKKITTILASLLLAFAGLQAQNCDFIIEPTSTEGQYSFTGPVSDFSPNMYTYWWTIEGNATFVQGASVIHTYNQTMMDSVILEVYNSDSMLVCTSVQSLFVLVNDTIVDDCYITYSNSPANINTYFFESDASMLNTVVWSVEGSNIEFIGSSFEYTFEQAGAYEVCSYVYSDQVLLCSNCVTVPVFGDTTNVGPVCDASFWASTSALTGYYIPEGYYYNNAYEYAWDFGDGQTSSEMYPYHIYDNEGTYNVCLTVSDPDGLCSESYCQNVFIPAENNFPIDSLCFADFVITQDNPFEVIVVNGSTGNNLDFTWTLTGGGISITSTGAFPTIEVENTGAFEFCLTVSDEFCSATYCDSIVVGENGIIGGKVSSAGFTINVMSPQAATDFPLAIENNEEILFSVYPNPFSNLLNIKTINTEAVSYEITSIDGRRISQGNISGDNQTINTSELNSGLYMLSISDKSGNRQIQKIIKK